MAQKAAKTRAKSNAASLNSMHLSSLALNIVFILFSIAYLKRSYLAYCLLSIPSFVCEFVLERTGRPTYDANGTLLRSGEDLAAQGLTEYMFDVVWITWASLLAVTVFGNYGWLVWLVVPAYLGYMAFGVFGKARGMMGGMQGMSEAGGAQHQQQQPMNRKQRRMAA